MIQARARVRIGIEFLLAEGKIRIHTLHYKVLEDAKRMFSMPLAPGAARQGKPNRRRRGRCALSSRFRRHPGRFAEPVFYRCNFFR